MLHAPHRSRIPRSSALWLSFLALALFLGAPVRAGEARRPDAAMLRYPDVGPQKIVFLYANDLWVVDRNGGEAEPLASPPGEELFPKFSPDGKAIAFTGNYDGDQDIYTLDVSGGVPFRVTHHPSTETLCDWTPEGKLLFFTSGLSGLNRMSKLYLVDARGGFPESLPVPYGADGAISPDGTWLAYTPYTRDARTWKRYRGGMATDIWLFNLRTHESKRITEWEGTDTLPMWHEKKVYYLSDMGPAARLNLWCYDTESGAREQVTHFTDYDVKWPSMGPGNKGQGEIVFQNGPGLYLLDLETSLSREVEVTIPGAKPRLRPRMVDASDYIQSWGISPTAKRAVVQARGDVWTLPAQHGSPRNLTRTNGTAERTPTWSPDGKWIAYFSDATGEYELYVMRSDGKEEPRQLTSGSRTFYLNAVWSPDARYIAFSDKACKLYIYDMEKQEKRFVDKDPWTQNRPVRLSWSHDSRWIAYARSDEDSRMPSIHLYNVEEGKGYKVTSSFFGDALPVFDRQGDYLYFTSMRAFHPSYSDVDGTFIYDESQVLLAVPLRADMKHPWLPESDEETWKDKEKKPEKNGKKGEKGEKKNGDEATKKTEAEHPVSAATDAVSGTWEGTARGTPSGDVEFTVHLRLLADNKVEGDLQMPLFSGKVSGTWDPAAKKVSLVFHVPDGGPTVSIVLTIHGDDAEGTWNDPTGTGTITAKRVSGGEEEGEETKEGDKKEGAKKKAPEKLKIDLEGFEARAILLPLSRGNFRGLAVNDRNQLLYVREGEGIKLFDMKDKKKQEKTVTSSAGMFIISADGKKILVPRGGSAEIMNAAAGASGKSVVTRGMNVWIDPRVEWKQIFTDAWRIDRDFFYVANMHGVDWPAVRERYEKMVEDCNSREDVGYVIREMISELNVGHSYYRGGGDTEKGPRVSVGLLGVDFTLENGAYRIARIYQGAAWDVDARNPLLEKGIDVKEGDYLLAVNGVPLDSSEDPWAAFVGLAGRTVTLTVSENPVRDDKARDVVVKTLSSERKLRYRAWIEHNRAYVERKTQGKVGYIYVPNTGIDGQNDLVRQYFGQVDKAALIIDERWNGGGQIPDRFIEMLNRPVSNYWARRDAKPGMTPSWGHQGPKCMLINGLAGSGGDMFPWLFRHAKLGKLVGMRTWGGLVGISGNPGFIDGGGITVPTFGFYETDGTWGVEGHGVDPDIEVIDDPALMVKGGDPQLDAAVDLMLKEIELHPYRPPKPPAPPDRSGMGIREEDK